jgi:hypothetical protein
MNTYFKEETMRTANSILTARRKPHTYIATVLFVLMSTMFGVQLASAATWDSTTLKMNPVKGEAVAYDQSNCTAPGAQGYMVFQDKPNVTYSYVGSNFNDKASCITLGPRTRVRLYQHKDFKGKTKDISNDDYDSIKQVVLSGWWDNTLSSIKVWTK